MNYRQNQFSAKFESAASVWGTKKDEIMSIKIRGVVNDYRQYQELISIISNLPGITCRSVEGMFQGKGTLISEEHVYSDSGIKEMTMPLRCEAIIIEHENGLEILYIIGSLASIFSLVPSIMQIWELIKDKDPARYGLAQDESIELRHFDRDGFLREEKRMNLSRHNYVSGNTFSFMAKNSLLRIEQNLFLMRNSIISLARDVLVLKQEVDKLPHPKRLKKKMTKETLEKKGD